MRNFIEAILICFITFFGILFFFYSLAVKEYGILLAGSAVYTISLILRRALKHKFIVLREIIYFIYAFFAAPFAVNFLSKFFPGLHTYYSEDGLEIINSGMVIYAYLLLFGGYSIWYIVMTKKIPDRLKALLMVSVLILLSSFHQHIAGIVLSVPILVFLMGTSPAVYVISELSGLTESRVLNKWIDISLPSVNKKT